MADRSKAAVEEVQNYWRFSLQDFGVCKLFGGKPKALMDLRHIDRLIDHAVCQMFYPR